jgi:tau tubulin kinase
MDLLGSNLAKVRKILEVNYSLKIAVQLLIEMLEAIEEVHERGFIHRDVEASNFVLSQDHK